MLFLKKKKNEYPKNAKYKIGDLVNFKYRGDIYFGFIYGAKEVENNEIVYTIQLGGQCPAFIYEYKEKDIMGLRLE